LLEVLCLLDPLSGPHLLALVAAGPVVTVAIRSSQPVTPDPALEWVVQFVEAGGAVSSVSDTLTLVFPAAS
jgi:hypothetical protein